MAKYRINLAFIAGLQHQVSEMIAICSYALGTILQ